MRDEEGRDKGTKKGRRAKEGKRGEVRVYSYNILNYFI